MIGYLDAREMIYDVYMPKWLRVRTAKGSVTAYTYVANPAHPQFAGKLPSERAAALVAAGQGASGSGIEYLENTLRHLEDRSIRDRRLRGVRDSVLQLVKEKSG